MDDQTIRTELTKALVDVACYHEGNGLKRCANPCRTCIVTAFIPVVRRLAEVRAYEAFEGIRTQTLHGHVHDDFVNMDDMPPSEML